MVDIDGSYGEGGGQILRSALALSLITGEPLRLRNIRAGRKKPGLRPQHLQAVKAAAAVGGARVEGAEIGGTRLTFVPGPVMAGDYRFDIGTAGAAPLVLQTVFLPLSLAGAPSRVLVTGGTHVPWSPCFHYLQLHWLPLLQQMGFRADLTLEKAGFYPRGGGVLVAAIRPAAALHPLRLEHRGKPLSLSCLSTVTGLDEGIARRQLRQAALRLEGRFPSMIQDLASLPGPGRGTLLFLRAEFECSRACHFALGERGKPAERVADEAADALEGFLATDGAVDRYLADQLILPLSLAGGVSSVRTAEVTRHLTTNIWVAKQFLPVEITLTGERGHAGEVRVKGAPGGGPAAHRLSGAP